MRLHWLASRQGRITALYLGQIKAWLDDEQQVWFTSCPCGESHEEVAE